MDSSRHLRSGSILHMVMIKCIYVTGHSIKIDPVNSLIFLLLKKKLLTIFLYTGSFHLLKI